MLNKDRFSGINVVVPTPLNKDDSIDFDGLKHLIDSYIESGCHGLTILGSGGEFPYFTFEERLEISKAAVAGAMGRVPVIVGAGFFSLVEILRFIRESRNIDLDAFLVAVPTYFGIEYNDLYDFFCRVCRESEKPVLYYNYPQQTKVFLSSDQIGHILSIDGIAGMKDSIIGIKEISRHITSVKDKDRVVLAGSCLGLVHILERGADGVIGLLPSLFPHTVVNCYHAWKEGQASKAWQLQDQLLDQILFLNTFNSPGWLQKTGFKILSNLPFKVKSRNPSRHAIFKEALRQMGHPITARVRSPLAQITDKDKKKIKEFLEKYKLS